MASQDTNFQAAQEIGKIYQSILEKKPLCDFFVESVSKYVQASRGYFFLLGREDTFWLEASTDSRKTAPSEIEERAKKGLAQGKPLMEFLHLMVPLVVRNNPVGIVCLVREESKGPFEQGDLDLAAALAAQMAGAFKNILLLEENLKMERLAAIGNTVGMVMHEIKNIMQLAQLSYEYTQKGVELKKENFIEKGLAMMSKALKEMNGFIWEMLSLSKECAIEPVSVDMPKLLKELTDDLRDKAQSFRVTLKLDLEENFPAVQADGRGLYRAILNLVKNSMEACHKEESTVTLSLRSCDEVSYQIGVEDNGDGMTQEVKARIFEAFFSTKGARGTGLGLMIIDRTIRAHHGTIEVKSELGEGTRITLTLPTTPPV
ncbi:MAG: ATP-binding protein [Candidatus Omnitrophota bacterium]|nr:ATP-binding protein [Candidatus Omnitrophota bacterium]